MLIKTWEPYRHMEIMYEKRARLRRLARRQDRSDGAMQAFATTLKTASEVTHAMTAAGTVPHHAKPHAVPLNTGWVLSPPHTASKPHAVTRWNIFGAQFF